MVVQDENECHMCMHNMGMRAYTTDMHDTIGVEVSPFWLLAVLSPGLSGPTVAYPRVFHTTCVSSDPSSALTRVSYCCTVTLIWYVRNGSAISNT